jgi:hypothetical protein
MKLKILAAAALSALAVGAQAQTTIDWDDHAPLEIAAVLANAGSFTDTITFSIGIPSHVSSTTVANNLLSVLNVEDGMVSLFQEAGATDTLIGSYDFDGTTGSTWHTFTSLAAGDYYYQVTGNATGSSGGFYSLTSAVQAVPEPETYALLLAGLGIMGSLYRRRKVD